MTTQAKVLLTGIAVFLIAIAAFMLIGTNSGKAPGSAQALPKPDPGQSRQSKLTQAQSKRIEIHAKIML